MSGYIKKSTENNFRIAQLAARFSAILSSILSYRYSLRWFCTSYVDRTARIIGWKNLQLGNNCVVAAGVLINVNNRQSGLKSISIGDNVSLGRDCFVAVGNSIIFREYCMIAPKCAFIGSSHIVVDPLVPYLKSGVTVQHNIYLGVNCWIGYGSTVRGNVRIGCGSVIGANSVVTHDIPPFSIAFGNPARVIKTFCFEKNEWIGNEVGVSYPSPSEEEYLSLLQTKYKYFVQPMAVFKSGLGDL